MRRAQLVMLVWTGMWLIALLAGLALFIMGITGPDINSSSDDWTTYPEFNSNWTFGAGALVTSIAFVAAVIDAIARVTLWIAWAMRRSRRNRSLLVTSR